MSWKSTALGSVANKVMGLYELGLCLMQKLLRAYRVPSTGAEEAKEELIDCEGVRGPIAAQCYQDESAEEQTPV